MKYLLTALIHSTQCTFLHLRRASYAISSFPLRPLVGRSGDHPVVPNSPETRFSLVQFACDGAQRPDATCVEVLTNSRNVALSEDSVIACCVCGNFWMH